MTFGAQEMAALTALLRAAARAEIMPRFRRLSAEAVRQKTGPLDLVTDADEAAEAMISAGLKQLFPGCVVVGEEAASADSALLNALAGAPLAVVLDPVDGTANFAGGLPLFGVMAAVLVRGEIVAAAIHDPIGDDTATALSGEGAWMERPGAPPSRMRVAAPESPSRMAGSVSWRHLPEPSRSAVLRNLPAVAASWEYRCAAHQYRLLAGGHCHFSLFGRMLPWDHAPGVLLHREAGGFAARFDGDAYSPLVTDGGLIAAPDRASWAALRDALLG